MSSFHVGSDLGILFEMLAAHIGAQLGLGSLFVSRLLVTFGSISLKYSNQNWVSEAVPLRMYQRVAFEKHSLHTVSEELRISFKVCLLF